MEKTKYKKRKHYLQQNTGDAMILAICVLAVVTVLCLSLLLISGIALNNAQKKLSKEQARVLAVSYNSELEKQITKTYASSDKAPADGIWKYLRDHVYTSVWPYYNEDEPGHTERFSYRTYEVDTTANATVDSWYKGILTDMELTMYWTSETGALASDTYLYTVVTATRNGQSSTITTTYKLDVTTPETGGEDQWKWQMEWRE